MFVSRRDATTDDEVRERFVRVIGLPELDDVEACVPADPAGSTVVSGSAVPSGSAAPVGGAAGGPTPGGAAFVGWPSGLRGVLGALDPGRRGVRALALVAVIGVAVAAFVAWRSRPQVEPVAATRAEPAVSTAAPTAGTSGVIVVAVTGRVRHPGLLRLPAGARVADAIEAAGGVQPDTDLSFVNVARKLVDGELVAVGVTPPPGATTGSDGAAAPGGPLNLNSATATQFETLPGIGPVLAQHIVDYRTRHGQFRSVDELRQVDGLGASRFAQIKPLVTV